MIGQFKQKRQNKKSIIHLFCLQNKDENIHK